MKLPVAENAWLATFGSLIVCGILSGLVIAACGQWAWVAAWLNSSNAPGWVQAVGSIGAILGTMWAAQHQVTKQAAEQERVRRQVDHDKLVKAFLIYSQLCDNARECIHGFSTGYKDPIVHANLDYFIVPLAASLEGIELGLSGSKLLDELPTDLVVSKAGVLVVLADLRALLEQLRRDHESSSAREQEKPPQPRIPADASDAAAGPDEKRRTLALALLEGRLKTALRFFDEQEIPLRRGFARSVVPNERQTQP